MAELAAITPERHAKKVWKHVTDYAFAAEDTVIPLVGPSSARRHWRCLSALSSIDAGYQLVAITSLQPGTNLYVAPDGKWLGAYIPLPCERTRFQLAQQEGQGNSSCASTKPAGWWWSVRKKETLSSTIKTSPLRESRISLISSLKSRPAGLPPRGP